MLLFNKLNKQLIYSENKETLLRVSAASDAISYGALVEQKIRSTNNWSLLDSQAMYSSVLPGYYMHGTMRQPQFPGWLGKNSKRTKLSRMVTEIHIHSKPKYNKHDKFFASFNLFYWF